MAKKEATKEAEVKEETKAVAEAPQQTKAMAEAGSIDDMSQWGASSAITSKDIIIPRILLMQPMSDKVTAGEAAFGELRESLANEKLGDFNTKLNIVPFYMEKVFVEFNVEDPEDKLFLRVVPITPANENLPYEDEEFNEKAGKKIKISRDRTMNFYVLLPSEIDLGTALPYILSFRRSNLQGGKQLATQMYVKNINSGKTPASVVMEVAVGKQSNEKKQTWAVLNVKPSSPAKVEHIEAAFKWLKMVKDGKAKVDESSYAEEARVETAVASGEVVDVDVNKGPAQF